MLVLCQPKCRYHTLPTSTGGRWKGINHRSSSMSSAVGGRRRRRSSSRHNVVVVRFVSCASRARRCEEQKRFERRLAVMTATSVRKVVFNTICFIIFEVGKCNNYEKISGNETRIPPFQEDLRPHSDLRRRPTTSSSQPLNPQPLSGFAKNDCYIDYLSILHSQ